MQIHNAVITGSFSYNGADLSNVTSSNAYSASLSTRVTQIEQVYATTGSNSFRANQSITGSLTVTGQIIAQSLNVQQITSSIVYSSGSNTFGCDLNSRQTFTGSFYQTGSVAIFNSCVGIGTDRVCSKLIVETNASPTLTGWITSGTQFAANMTFGYASLNIGAYDNGSNCRYGWIRTAFSDNAAVPNDMVFLTGPSERVRIISTGVTCFACQVCMPRLIVENGIGQASIFRQTDSTSYSSLRLYNDQNSANRALEIDYFGSTYSTGERSEIFNTGAYPMLFGTSNTCRVSISSAGITSFACQICAPVASFKNTGQYNSVIVDNGCAQGGGGYIVQQNGVPAGGIGVSGWWEGGTSCDMGLAAYGSRGIRFYTDGGSEKMRVSSAGIVTMPSQVSFKAYLSANINPSKSTNVTVPYNVEEYDTQGNFSTSTYKFTAPVAGKYLFTVNFNAYSLDDTAYLRLMLLLNASTVRTLFLFQNMPTGNTGDVNVSGADILNLSAGNTVEVRVYTDGSGTFGMSQALDWNSFSGHLLG